MKTEPVYIIAEAGVNHNGNLATALELIDCAAEAGADAVKFQTFKSEKLASPESVKAAYQVSSTGSGGSQLDMLKSLELGKEDHEKMIRHSSDRGIDFLSTPFDLESVEMLESLGVPGYKISSGDLTNLPLLRKISEKNKPVFLSTGMSTLEEVREAFDAISLEGKRELTLLHCVSQYPAPADQVNLRAIPAMKKAFGVPVGYSDHTLGIEVALSAVAIGACVIEKHVTLDRNMSGPDHRASIEPHQLVELVKKIRNVSASLGDGRKIPADCEIENIEVVRKSIYAGCYIPAGRKLEETMLEFKRPGTGISPMKVDKVIGRKTIKSIESGEVIKWDHLA